MKKGFLLALLITCSPGLTSASKPEPEAVFKQKCDKCHSLQYAVRKDKDLEGWKRTVRRMAKYAKGEILEDDVNTISEFLVLSKAAQESRMPAMAEKKKPSISEQESPFDFKKVRVDQFIEPSTCEGCHSEQFKQWNGSMHSKAFVDPLWRKATKLFFKESKKEGDILEMKSCVKCHTPLGFRSHSISSPEDDFDKLASLPAQGVFCNWCHNISEAKEIGDAAYELDPGGGEDDPATMLGPFKDAYSDYHPTRYSELHTKSEFCGLCHNVSHAANHLPIEATYDEWKNGPYNTGDPQTTVTCQDCHMRQRPGIPSTGKTERPDNPGKGADYGPDRKHVWTHYFVGANAVVTKRLKSEIHSRMAVERLQNAADLEILKSDPYEKGSLAQVTVKVINSGAGHNLPTGLTEVRQMWLDVTISDREGTTLLRSGALVKEGAIDQGAVVYYTQLGNEAGEPVINIAKADRILYDHRIPPKGYALEKYVFKIPSDAVSPLTLEAALNYRSLSQGLARTLLGESAPEIPVIEMVRAKTRLEIR